KEKRSAFFSEPPFAPPANVDVSTVRSLTFSASLSLAAAAVSTFINEQSDFLMAPLPIADVGISETSPLIFPYYATGGGWQTEIRLVNPTDSPLSGVAQFYESANALGPKGLLTNRELEQRIGSVYEHARLATLNSGAAKPPDDFGPSAEEMLRSIIENNHKSFLSAADRFSKACKSESF